MPGDPPGERRLRFSQSQRLQRGWEFERTRREGHRIMKGCLILNWKTAQEQGFSRLGVITSKKIGNSVARSRARRLLREVFRLHQYELQPAGDLVLIARQSIVGKTCGEVEKDFVTAAKQAKLLREG